MKIDNSSPQQIKSAPASEKQISKKGMPINPGKIKTPSSDKSHIIVSQLDKLIVSLKSSPLLNMKGLSKVLPPLNELLQILANSSFEPFDSDVLLMEKFINSWLKKYGGSLPVRQKKDLTELNNLLKSSRLEAKDNDESRSVYSHSSGNEGDIPSWKVDFRKHQNPVSSGEDDSLTCVFDLETENLGLIRTTVTEHKNRKKCLFVSSNRETVKRIGDSISDLKKQLNDRGIEIPLFSVTGKREDLHKQKSTVGKGLDLWG